MHRLWKLLWMIFIFCVVFFIICDEKWYKIQLNENRIFFSKIEDQTEPVNEETLVKVVYKSWDLINLNYEFKNPKTLKNSSGMDPEYLAKLEQERKELEEEKKRQVYTWPNIISVDKNNSISSFLHPETWADNQVKKIPLSSLRKYRRRSHSLNLLKVASTHDFQVDTWSIITKYQPVTHHISLKKWVEIIKSFNVNKYQLSNHTLSLKLSEEPIKVKVEKYDLNRDHYLNLRKWVEIEHEFVVKDTSTTEESLVSDEMLESLLQNDEIDVDTLESENDEFLQKVFEKTKDVDVMNLIVETYLNEYQFVKAKKFIEWLPQNYADNLKPSLNLRVVFNSFSLSSKTTNETLTLLIQNYLSKNQISMEDWNRYLWVLALMQRSYDDFFTISNSFTSENHKSFAAKIQWYKDQISKQMWMPDYYFDTLVALELFNEWFFQPAKVLALYSLQQNSSYILPYQILAYSNFLTNSRDTSIEYLKKLVDLDPNNAEKYQFLMWVAYYWNEKYEQSVIMLSLVKNEKLRLDSERYLIRNYLFLDQKNKLILSWNKMLWYDNLVASDFYTYFYEVFYRPYSEWYQYQLYAIDTELAEKMTRLCAVRLTKEWIAVCNYGIIGKNIALWKYDWLEQSLFDLVSEYPQWYLYRALWDYYVQQWDLEKAKVYLLKAFSLSQKWIEKAQIKRMLQSVMSS